MTNSVSYYSDFSSINYENLTTGDFVDVGGFAEEGDGGAFRGVVESLNNLNYPNGGRIRPISDILRPEMWGGFGDGITNYQDRYDQLCAFNDSICGKPIHLANGKTYIGGRQPEHSSWRSLGHYIFFGGLNTHFELQLNGATIKFADGFLFGSFEPGTENVHTVPEDTLFIELDHAAHIGQAVEGDRCASFKVRGAGVIDGNGANQVVGGYWGSPNGWQIRHYGIYTNKCENVDIDAPDLMIKNFLLDGVAFRWAGLDENTELKPHTLNCTIDMCGRQCISITGSNFVRIPSGVYRNAGECPNSGAPNGIVSSAPKSCFDIEAESAINRNVIVGDAKFISGEYTNTAMVAGSGDSADISFNGTEFVGTVWADKPRMSFHNCTIHGQIGRALGGQNKLEDNTKFINCTMDDVRYNGSELNSDNITPYSIQGGNGSGVLWQGGSMRFTTGGLNAREFILKDTIAYFEIGTDILDDRTSIVLSGNNSLYNNVKFVDMIKNNIPVDAFIVQSAGTVNSSEVISPNAKLRWVSWGASGWTGQHTTDFDVQTRLNLRRFPSGNTTNNNGANGARSVISSNAIPTNGTWSIGDMVLDYNRTLSSAESVTYRRLGWVCRAAGTPGTWEEMWCRVTTPS